MNNLFALVLLIILTTLAALTFLKHSFLAIAITLCLSPENLSRYFSIMCKQQHLEPTKENLREYIRNLRTNRSISIKKIIMNLIAMSVGIVGIVLYFIL